MLNSAAPTALPKLSRVTHSSNPPGDSPSRWYAIGDEGPCTQGPAPPGGADRSKPQPPGGPTPPPAAGTQPSRPPAPGAAPAPAGTPPAAPPKAPPAAGAQAPAPP
eukprot:5267125-Pyramimonas_sp.AAC.1